MNFGYVYSSVSYHNAGTVYGGLDNPKLTFSDSVKLRVGINKVSLLSVSVGLPVSSLTWILFFTTLLTAERYAYDVSIYINMYQNVGVHFETWNAGVLGPVTLKGLNEGTRDLSKQKWSYKVCCLWDFSFTLFPY